MADLEDYFLNDTDEDALWHWLLVLQVEREEEKRAGRDDGNDREERKQ